MLVKSNQNYIQHLQQTSPCFPPCCQPGNDNAASNIDNCANNPLHKGNCHC